MIGYIVAFLSWLLSPLGMFAVGIGLIMFLAMPVIPRALGIGKQFANVHLWFAMWSVKRAAIVVSEHGELLFKRMEFDDLGVEKITFDETEKEFEDPAMAMHHWMSFPFALADEVHGLLFDPRHVAIGQRKQDARETNDMFIRATDSEAAVYNVYGWVKGAFEFERGAHELVDLTQVRAMTTGNERSEYPARIVELYKHSRDPHNDGPSRLRLLIPPAALIIVLGAFWQFGGDADASVPTDTISFGGAALWLLVSRTSIRDAFSRARNAVAAVDWLWVAKWLVVLLPVPSTIALIYLYVSPVLAILMSAGMALGFMLIPLCTLLCRPSDRASGAFARYLYLKLGLLGYDKPVWEWTPSSYRLREFDDLDDTAVVNWFGLANSLVGFTFTPEPDAFGAEVIENTELENGSEIVPDGGEDKAPTDSNIPPRHTRFPEIQRAHYAGYVPNKVDDSKYYLNSGIALSRFTNAALGEKSIQRLFWAKERYGTGWMAVSDRTIAYLTVGCTLLGFVSGIWLFVL